MALDPIATKTFHDMYHDELKRLHDAVNRNFDRIEQLEAALRGVIAVADRNCPEFRAAHAALAEGNKDD
jgi:hypothetical protein